MNWMKLVDIRSASRIHDFWPSVAHSSWFMLVQQDSQASQKALASEVTNLQAAMKKQAVCWKPAECASGGRWLYRRGTNVIRKWSNDGCWMVERWMDERTDRRTDGQTDAWMSTTIGCLSLNALPNLRSGGRSHPLTIPSIHRSLHLERLVLCLGHG